jgi:putative ABC transport system ATP-binding protein
MIEVKGVTKIYGKRDSAFTALSDINLNVNDGATVAIIGKSGSGKSTLMHIMSGLDRPSDGHVTVDGEVLQQMKPKARDAFRAEAMSFIFQAFFVEGNQTCYQNVMLPLEIAEVRGRDRKQRVLEALEAVDLSEKVNSKARNLSGGQKQRLAIARAIVNKPKLIFADEPTGNLDSATGEKVIELLFNINKTLGSTLVIVTHDSELAARCQIQIHMKDGKIINISEGSKRGVAKSRSKKKVSRQ